LIGCPCRILYLSKSYFHDFIWLYRFLYALHFLCYLNCVIIELCSYWMLILLRGPKNARKLWSTVVLVLVFLTPTPNLIFDLRDGSSWGTGEGREGKGSKLNYGSFFFNCISICVGFINAIWTPTISLCVGLADALKSEIYFYIQGRRLCRRKRAATHSSLVSRRKMALLPGLCRGPCFRRLDNANLVLSSAFALWRPFLAHVKFQHSCSVCIMM